MVMMIKMVMTAMMATISTICDIDDGGDHDREKVGIGVRMVIIWTYLILVIFFTRAKFLENKIYTEKNA